MEGLGAQVEDAHVHSALRNSRLGDVTETNMCLALNHAARNATGRLQNCCKLPAIPQMS